MNIAIVGGGTAGWIAAYFIVKDRPGKHNITVIESSKIGIIGAGEGSTGTMLDLLNGSFFPYTVDIPSFLKEVDGTLKMGIYHQNWTGDGSGYFAPLDASPTMFNYNDYIFKHVFSKFGKERMHIASTIGLQFEKNECSQPHAFHFDGRKVGQFFKKICEKDGVKVIDAVVKDVTVDSNKIEKIILDNDAVIEADFFIDCTGFSRILMKKLGVEWVSYKKYLPVNTAMPFLLDYETDEKMSPMTTATALDAGWMWNIPLTTRKGCGYVFDSNYISKKQAQSEVEEYLGKKIKPIKFIDFDSGISEKFWKNNVLCLGLSSAFVEPLEATSIHSTIIQLLIFVKEYLYNDINTTLSQENEDLYNEKISILFESTVDFISFHYQGNRSDTPFWRDIRQQNKCTPKANKFYKKSKNKISSFLEINGIIGSPAAGLWNWIAAGLGIITPEQAADELKNSNLTDIACEDYIKFIDQPLSKKYITYL